MADRGKRPMTPEEENADTWANKKRTRLTPVDGRRIEAIPETFDPSFHGPPPASMHFSTEDGSFALHPLPATSWKQLFPLPQTSSSWSDNDPWLPVRWGRPVYRDGLWHFVVPTDGSLAYMDESTFYRVRNRRYGWPAYPGPIYWDT